MELTILTAIRPGDNLELHYINSLNQDVLLETLVYDITAEDEILIHNPLKDRKLFMIPMGISIMIFAKRPEYGVIAFSVELIRRQKMGNVYTIVCKVISDIQRQQRRNFFRVSMYEETGVYIMVDKYHNPVNYYIFDPDAVEDSQVNTKVTVLDISGGGIGLKSSAPLPIGTVIYLNLDFINIPVDIHGTIVRCIESQKYVGEYELGVVYDDMPTDVLRNLNAFVFTKQQKTRRKEMGNA